MNVRKFIEFRMSVNISTLFIIMVTVCLNKNSPFTNTQILMINLFMKTFAAVMLAYQNPRESNNKLQHEISKKDPILSEFMWVKIILNSLLISGICLYIY